LRNPIAIANVDECNAAMIALAMHPSIEYYSFSYVRGTKLATSDRSLFELHIAPILYRGINMGKMDYT
jgi:hypothetical protein